MSRPKRNAKKDRNHALVSNVLEQVYGATKLHANAYHCTAHGLTIIAVDTSDVGGLIGDWLVWMGEVCYWVEVKHPDSRNRLTYGESTMLRYIPQTGRVVTTEQEFLDLIQGITNEG